MSDKKAQKKEQAAKVAAAKPQEPTATTTEPSKRSKKKKGGAAAPAAAPAPTPAADLTPAAPAEDEWTLVTNRRRNGRKWPDGKRIKKGEDAEPRPQRTEPAATGGRTGQPQHGRDPRKGRPHTQEEIIPIEHTKDVAKVILFVTTEDEDVALRKALEGRPYEVAAVATLEGAEAFADKENLKKVRLLAGVEAVRELMKELGVGLFVLPVDDSLVPAPRMTAAVSKLLDVAVRAGAYALTVSITPLETEGADRRMFFAAVPTHESKQLLVDTLGVVEDSSVRQDFEINGFNIPEKPGLFDIWTSLMNSAVKKYKVCGEAEILPNGDQFVQDVAAQTKKAAHYPVFTVSFRVGKLEHYTSHQSNRIIYEIHSDDVIPDTLKNIFILLGVPVRQKLTIIVSKYQGQVKTASEDTDKKVDVEFEKIIYSYSSLTDTPIFELYLPRYVDPTAVAAPAPAPAPAAAPSVPATETAAPEAKTPSK